MRLAPQKGKMTMQQHMALRLQLPLKRRSQHVLQLLPLERALERFPTSTLIGHWSPKRRLRWFYHFERHPDGELIKDRRTGGQLKTWETRIKGDLEPLSGSQVFGYAQWRKDWVNASSELAQD